jgi:dihydrofolate reductase
MGTVILDMAMSLDGFAAGPNGEDRGLNDWFFAPTGRSAAVIQESIASTGAIVMGRRTYGVGDDAEGFSETPYDAAHFVLTSKPPTRQPKGEVAFTFVTDGITSALEQAQAAAGTRNVAIGGGPTTAQSFVKAGVLDEIQIHLITPMRSGLSRAAVCLLVLAHLVELSRVEVARDSRSDLGAGAGEEKARNPQGSWSRTHPTCSSSR